jgi:hypothetical protein
MKSVYKKGYGAKRGVFGLALIAFLGLGTTSERADTTRARTSRAAEAAVAGRPSRAVVGDRIAEAYGRLPLGFERNVGQTDLGVEFLARGKGYTLFLTRGGEAVLSLRAGRSENGSNTADHVELFPSDPTDHSGANGAALKVRLVGADPSSSGQGESELPGKVNYLVGTNRSAWRSGISTYARIHYPNIYPGIDVDFYGNQRELEYDFVVKPGADPATIELDFEGADRLHINDAGELVATIGARSLVQRKPVIYQNVAGVRNEVSGGYVLVSRTRVGFRVHAYDRERTLVIDPVLVYSTYLDGTLSVGSGAESGADITVDANGNVYVTGATTAVEFPTTAGALDNSWNGNNDVFITKLDASGTALVYSSYLGGSDSDSGAGIAVDAEGSAYVTGSTSSVNFPATLGTFDTSGNGNVDAFIMKLDATGGALIYSTYLGGSNRDVPARVAVGPDGSAYVTGTTSSADFPTTAGAFDATLNGSNDVFVTRLDPDAAALVFSTYLGGSSFETGSDIALDAAGTAYITGSTLSTDFPTTAGAFDTTTNGIYWDVFVSSLDPSGASLGYSSFLGGSYNDLGHAIAVDAARSAYVTGHTENYDFPTSEGAWDTSLNGFRDVFVTKLDPSGAGLIYSTYLGGGRDDQPRAIAVDAAGSAYITGYTTSSNFPTTIGTFDTDWNSSSGPISDVFVSKLEPTGAALAYSTYVGGSSGESGQGIALDATGSAYITGGTASTDFPTTPGAFDTTWNGTSDVFVTKLDPGGAALAYSTYLGGTFGAGGASTSGFGISVDTDGNTYVTGSTASINFPTTAGGLDTNLNGSTDVFVTKLNASGAELIYSTYLGGSGDDIGNAIAVDVAGSAYVTGYIFFFGASSSADFPATAGAFGPSWNGGYYDAFVAKLNPNGGALEYATYLGGSGLDVGQDIAVDAAGNAYVIGYTDAFADFPTTAGAFDTSQNGGLDAFVTKLNRSGAALEYSTYLGGAINDYGEGIAVDFAGNVYVTGFTSSADFPTTAGAFDTSWPAVSYDFDAFVTKLDRSGAGLVYSTYLGGSAADYGSAITVDIFGSAYVTGYTGSANFPTTAGAFDTSWNGLYDIFAVQIDRAGGALAYSTYLGGSGNDWGYGLGVDASGGVYLTGRTSSPEFPTTVGAFDTSWNGSYDAFVTSLAPGGAALGYSTYLGGGEADEGQRIAVDRRGGVYVVGTTSSPDFPTTAAAFDSTANGQSDAFVVKFSFLADADVNPGRWPAISPGVR